LLSLRLMSAFELRVDDEAVSLPMSVQRLVVFLAIQERAVLRPYTAGMLWPETSEERAAANLRSALWRLNRLQGRIVVATGATLQLDPAVRVDLRERAALAQRLLDERHGWTDADLDVTPFRDDLLPDWYDDWLAIERERFHQLRLRTLEAICDRLTEARRFVRALEAGLAAVAGEPLRESAHRALVRVHLAEGNMAEALRQFQLYRVLLQNQLGLAPSELIVELLRPSAAA
jgi:DNA-binding SARP family transcriptional activator